MTRYRDQLIALQPQGVALPTETDSNWGKLLSALAEEFERFHGRMDALTLEVLLHSGEELLGDWERALGLPDRCVLDNPPTDPTLRRQRIRAKLAETGGQSEAYFINLAAQLGLSAEIITFEPFEMGVSGMGDPIGGGEWRYVWQMNFPGTPDPERLALIQCIVSEAAPAHTQVLFSVGGNPEHVVFYCNGQFRCDGTRRTAG